MVSGNFVFESGKSHFWHTKFILTKDHCGFVYFNQDSCHQTTRGSIIPNPTRISKLQINITDEFTRRILKMIQFSNTELPLDP
ncbi:unnamed protein product [Allacma fusca]|uniref:Uncharacterized protein n=1 Tax=Allacma fusca TaxID=39272 RepID=A0A8J2NZC6_9HEXA|nr:unnamed protein product [Allacma fusca]